MRLFIRKQIIPVLAGILLAGCIQVVPPSDYYNPPKAESPKKENPDRPDKTAFAVPPARRHPGRNGALTDREMELARIAWKYFENNYQPQTGLVNSVQDYPSTTLWDTASYMGALVSAHELGIITRDDFNVRVSTLLATFNRMELFQNEMPNKCYNTQTIQKVNYGNQPDEIGFSAIDIGRFLIWAKIIKERYPEHGSAVDQIALRWNFKKIINEYGTMYGSMKEGDRFVYVQEGRLGYEEYAAKGFQLWGFDTTLATRPEPYSTILIYGVDVPYDTRDPRELVSHNYVVCESYVLDGIELNWDFGNRQDTDDLSHQDRVSADFAQRIYQVQENRYKKTGIFTARTEHQLDQAPYFVYDTIYTDGYPWNTITDSGEHVPHFAAVALKGAFGLWALWQTDYTDKLFELISGLYDPEKGFYEGRYENSGAPVKIFTANNNGIILETMLYKVQGKLLKSGNHPSLWDQKIQDVFQENNKHKARPGYREEKTLPVNPL